ncbi:hypothetical protein HYH02_010684 [Chlamydomonas schloesseri]|nr:hypothetical protein HYH02_010684 [Chlamydomonas schloesseri]|eukprot:KAG2438887.1 hypothetical protein HYH02_010684 [Chlamydomonas schloesseri]
MPAWARALLVGSGPLVLHLLVPLADMACGWWAGTAAAATGLGGASGRQQAATANAAPTAPPLGRAVRGIDAEDGAPPTQPPGPDNFWARALPMASILTHMAAVLYALTLVSAAATGGIPPPAAAAAAASAASPAAAVASTATTAAVPALLPLLAFTLAAAGAVAFGAIHELIHSRHPGHLTTMRAFLALFWWSPAAAVHHWHHKVMCTPKDHTCAPRGMTVYAFIPRYVVGSYAKAWALAAEACRRNRKPILSPHNSALVAWTAQLLSLAAISMLLGPTAAAFHAAVCAGMLVYIGALDYTFHYGLVRPPAAQLLQPLPPAGAAAAARDAELAADQATGATAAAAPSPQPPREYAPVTRFNSWSSSYPLENAMTCHGLQHAEHHISAGTSHAWLRATSARNPRLPAPLLLMALAGFVPPLWRAVMDPRADDANSQNLAHLRAAAKAAHATTAARCSPPTPIATPATGRAFAAAAGGSTSALGTDARAAAATGDGGEAASGMEVAGEAGEAERVTEAHVAWALQPAP